MLAREKCTDMGMLLDTVIGLRMLKLLYSMVWEKPESLERSEY